jgi:hypothetical protein
MSINKISPCLKRYKPGEITKSYNENINKLTNMSEDNNKSLSIMKVSENSINSLFSNISSNLEGKNCTTSQLKDLSHAKEQTQNILKFDELDSLFEKMRIKVIFQKSVGCFPMLDNIFKRIENAPTNIPQITDKIIKSGDGGIKFEVKQILHPQNNNCVQNDKSILQKEVCGVKMTGDNSPNPIKDCNRIILY